MRTISSLLLGAALSFALVGGVSARDTTADNTNLSNININGGNAGLTNSSSLGGGRIGATTTSTTTSSRGLNQNPAGNNGIGGSAAGFTETTFLRAGGDAVANTTLSGNGLINGNFTSQTKMGEDSRTGQNLTGTTINSNGFGTLQGSFTRTANSYAGAGLQGYSGAQMVGGNGTITNTTSGSAFGVGAAITGGASLRGN